MKIENEGRENNCLRWEMVIYYLNRSFDSVHGMGLTYEYRWTRGPVNESIQRPFNS